MKKLLTNLILITAGLFFIYSCSSSVKKNESKAIGSKKMLWEFDSNESQTRLLFINNDKIYALAGDYLEFGNPGKVLFCLDLKSGKVVWSKKREASDNPANQVILQNGKIIWNSSKQMVIKAESGVTTKIGRARSYKSLLNAKKAHLNGKKYVIKNNILYCEDAVTAKTIWKWEKKALKLSSLQIADNKVFFIGMPDRKIYVLKSETPELLGKFDIPIVKGVKSPNAINFNFLIKNNVLYLGLYNGKVQAYNLNYSSN